MGILYLLLIYRNIRTVGIKITAVLELAAALGLNCFVLDFGSKSQITSTKIIAHGNVKLIGEGCRWLKVEIEKKFQFVIFLSKFQNI